jgi:hypothetical protein
MHSRELVVKLQTLIELGCYPVDLRCVLYLNEFPEID